MNKDRNHEDVMMSVVRLLWGSDYSNEVIAEVMVDLGCRLNLMEVPE